MVEFKSSYVERYKLLLGDEWEIFKEAIVRPLPASFRINTLKIGRKEILERLKEYGWNTKHVPFYDDGLVFEGKKPVVLGNTLEHFLGYIYIQEVASMIPPVALNPEQGDKILDLAAAPGSKTTQIAQMIDDKGVIVANEKILSRLASLRSNLQRCGVKCVITTNTDGRNFRNAGLKFDKVLLDAPCSGTGAIMKSPKTLQIWSENTSKGMSNIQKQLLNSAAAALSDGGTLVYSTCSLEPEEDEENVDWAIRKLGLSVEKIALHGFKTRKGIMGWGKKNFDSQVENCIRVYPQDSNTEGFFIAKLRRV